MREMCEADTEVHGLVIALALTLDYELGSRLDGLREDRNDADYVLSPTRSMDVERANLAIERADFIRRRELPSDDAVDEKMDKVTEIVKFHYTKYRKRRYHELADAD